MPGMTTNPSPDEATYTGPSLDQDHIQAAAKWAAGQLDRLGHARVMLTPGDMTVYPIVIVSPACEQWGEQRDHRSYLVALGGRGRMYPWYGDTDLHHTYVTEHWTHDSQHEGFVLAAFLNATRSYLTF